MHEDRAARLYAYVSEMSGLNVGKNIGYPK
jgi:hypothetical protein